MVRSIFYAIKDSRAVGQAFNINGPDKLTWNEYFRELAAALKMPAIKDLKATESKIRSAALGVLKPAALFAGGRYGDLILRLGSRLGLESRIERIRSFLRTTPSNFELELFSREAHYSYEKAADSLGYCPRYDLQKGVELSAKWLSHEGYLERFGG
jgi:nucleoside-diphosphate-sugar epimerase